LELCIHLAESELSPQGDATAEPLPRTLHLPINRIDPVMQGGNCSGDLPVVIKERIAMAFRRLDEDFGPGGRTTTAGREFTAELHGDRVTFAFP
jgi:hypothetical protein